VTQFGKNYINQSKNPRQVAVNNINNYKYE